MTRALSLAGALLLAIRGVAMAQGSLASGLIDGMQLIYASDGRVQPPWVVDSVRTAQPLRPASQCAMVALRRRPSDPRPDRSKLCLAADTLYRWEAARNAWDPFRPVGPDMTLTLVRANGDTVRYETGALGEDMVSGQAVTVVSTTVTTVDRQGRPRLRVRERFAVSLATAVSGTFEAPDPSSPGHWVTRHTFTLREVVPPR